MGCGASQSSVPVVVNTAPATATIDTRENSSASLEQQSSRPQSKEAQSRRTQSKEAQSVKEQSTPTGPIERAFSKSPSPASSGYASNSELTTLSPDQSPIKEPKGTMVGGKTMETESGEVEKSISTIEGPQDKMNNNSEAVPQSVDSNISESQPTSEAPGEKDKTDILSSSEPTTPLSPSDNSGAPLLDKVKAAAEIVGNEDLPEDANNKKITHEEIVAKLEEKVKWIKEQTDFADPELSKALKYVAYYTRISASKTRERANEKTNTIMDCGYVSFLERFMEAAMGTDENSFLFIGNSKLMANFKSAFVIAWNSTDKTLNNCMHVFRSPTLIKTIFAMLNHPDIQPPADKNMYIRTTIKGLTGMLHNVIQFVPEARETYQEENGVQILQKHMDSTFLIIKFRMLIVLSYIISEAESDILNSTDQHFKFILSILDNALTQPNHHSKRFGYWAIEIVAVLNKLAVTENNKQKIVASGALPLYVKLLQADCSPQEQTQGALGIWTLAFSEESRQQIRDEPGCLEALKILAYSEIEEVSHAAKGAMFVIQDKIEDAHAPVGEDTDEDNTDYHSAHHIMISYQWDNKPIMLQVRNHLRESGFKVWMDVDNMTGSTLEAMADAVERAAVVLVCMSQKYKESPSCRTEAEYTYRLHKDVVPLRLQPRYLADGWLGAMMGTKLWFDISDDDKVTSEIPRIVKELGKRGFVGVGKIPSNVDSLDAASYGGHSMPPPDLTPVAHTQVKTLASPRPQAVVAPQRHSAKYLTWKSGDIEKWLKQHNLGHVYQSVNPMDGELLHQLIKMWQISPDFFYRSLKEDLKLNFLEILKFSKALDELIMAD